MSRGGERRHRWYQGSTSEESLDDVEDVLLDAVAVDRAVHEPQFLGVLVGVAEQLLARAEEKRAFLDFVAYVEERRKAWPDLHVYHYASYEKTALRNLSVRHTAAEETVDGWLRDGLLVDLLDTVRHSLRISADSYSIKKLEPFYMDSGPREGDVTNAGASVVAYARYAAAGGATYCGRGSVMGRRGSSIT